MGHGDGRLVMNRKAAAIRALVNVGLTVVGCTLVPEGISAVDRVRSALREAVIYPMIVGQGDMIDTYYFEGIEGNAFRWDVWLSVLFALGWVLVNVWLYRRRRSAGAAREIAAIVALCAVCFACFAGIPLLRIV